MMDDPRDYKFDRQFNSTFRMAKFGIFVSAVLGIAGVGLIIGGIVWLVNTPAVQQLLGY